MPVREALRMATRGGAVCLGRTDLGCIEAGKVADIVLFDADALECAGGQEDLVAAVVLGDLQPDSVLVHGEFVVRHGELTRCDRAELSAEQNACAARLMARWGEQ
jgi:8-oxoguanine deaminase